MNFKEKLEALETAIEKRKKKKKPSKKEKKVETLSLDELNK